MNRADQFWAQTLDTVASPETRAGLEYIAEAVAEGVKVRAWYRSGYCFVNLTWPDGRGWGASGKDLMDEVANFGDRDVF